MEDKKIINENKDNADLLSSFFLRLLKIFNRNLVTLILKQKIFHLISKVVGKHKNHSGFCFCEISFKDIYKEIKRLKGKLDKVLIFLLKF